MYLINRKETQFKRSNTEILGWLGGEDTQADFLTNCKYLKYSHKTDFAIRTDRSRYGKVYCNQIQRIYNAK